MGMPLLKFLFRKMWNTRWLTLSSLMGLLLAVAFATSIPMYADGALKRVVTESLKEKSEGLPAGSLLMRYQAPGGTTTELERLKDVNGYIEQEVPALIGFPGQTYVRSYSIRGTDVVPEDPTKVDASRSRQLTLATMSGLQEKAELTQGSWYSEGASDGEVLETVMLEEAMYRSDIHIGDVFDYPVYSGLNLTLKVKIVGAYKPLNDTDPYWYQGLESLMTTALVSEEALDTLMQDRQVPIQNASWYYVFDLSNIQTSGLNPLGRTLERLNVELYQRLQGTKVEISFASTLQEFRTQSLQLQTMLFTLAAPMLAMVFYFIAMNARQSLDKQRSDIAVLRSRGAGTGQIIRVYLLEGLLLGAIALAAGPFLGWFMAKSIGSANGFLSFVNRKSIPIGFGTEAIIAGGTAVLLAILATVIPAVIYARASIVSYKRDLARSDRGPFWQRWYLDLVMLAAAGYGWYLFSERRMLAMETGMTTDQLNVQPVLFFVPALSIFAIGLFALRLFPWLLKLFNLLGRKFLPVPLYLTLTQLSRSSKSYYPLMILLILTLGLGVYNASAARTIDLNSEERILYRYGTDVIVQTVWEGTAVASPNQNGGGGEGGNGGGQPAPAQILYSEPPFEIFRSLEGVEAAARVLQAKASVIVSGRSIGQGTVMGINNDDFAKVAWFRDDLFPVHPYNYLANMGLYEHAALIPTSVAEQYQLKLGDSITAGFADGRVEFVIVGILPYWPSQYPDQSPFIIANLDYIYDQLPLMPYEVWLKMKDGAKVAPLLGKLEEQGIAVASVRDVRNELITQAKLPTRGGIFGILSLGFLVSAIVTLVGYVLYWFFHLSGRVIQFGVLRAMGLSRGQLTGMLLLEQLLTAGLSIGLGIGTGKLTSLLFLPFLQTVQNTADTVPPFRVVFRSEDMLQLYAVVGCMTVMGALLLILHIRRLRVHQAVKMGEER